MREWSKAEEAYRKPLTNHEIERLIGIVNIKQNENEPRDPDDPDFEEKIEEREKWRTIKHKLYHMMRSKGR